MFWRYFKIKDKIIIIADIHFGDKSFSKQIFEYKIKFFQEFFFPFIKQQKVKHIVFLGDLFHNRNIIDNYIKQRVQEEFIDWFKDNNINLYLICGNHDIYYKNTRKYSILKSLNLSDNIKLYIDNDYYIENIAGYKCLIIPWIIDKFPKIDEKSKNFDFVFGHFEFSGINVSEEYKISKGLNISNLTKQVKFNKCFSGHYHNKVIKDDIIYVGSPFQMNWNDFDIEKGFYLVNDVDNLNFIRNDYSPKFLKIYYNELEDDIEVNVLGYLYNQKILKVKIEELFDLVKNNFVTLIIKNIKNQELFDTFYAQLSEVSLSKIDVVDLRLVFEDSTKIEKEQEIKNIKEVINNYTDLLYLPEGIKQDNIKKLFFKLYEESQERIKEVI